MKRVLQHSLRNSAVFLSCLIWIGSASLAAVAAEDLQLRPGVSFGQDIDNGFPIVGKRMDDAVLEPGRAALVFFGAAGDLNTNRQAKRVVELYRKVLERRESDRKESDRKEPDRRESERKESDRNELDNDLKFIVVDVDHPLNDDGKKLIKAHYKGYIPYQVLIDKKGRVCWNQIGEVELSVLRKQIDKLQQANQ
jgi:hypothetical protein